MSTIILKLLALLLPVAIGYILKRRHFFGNQDYRVLTKIALNITLPAAVITSFANFKMDFSLLGVALFSFAANWVVLLSIYLLTMKQKNPHRRALQMICGSGFNMGNFVIPFVQQFLGAEGVATTAIFDSGNTFMCTGGIYIFTTAVVPTGGEKTTIKSVCKKLFQPVLITYMVMIVMALLQIPVPQFLTVLAGPTGSANSFLSMMMIGLMMEIQFSREYVRDTVSTLGKKYLVAAVLALLVYFCSPFALLTKKVIVLSLFAPVPSISSIFVDQAGGDRGLASFITSCSFLCSCVILSILITILGVA